ncbi:hypothetical protein N8I71_06150 [Roseibacterium sp. SDUM158016]|jgi:hypothetical protein|uniref:hypothetical protein n=1 Tax=Roseicyclus sediminis TaxID=2980997 RepID=UPI0021D2576A|nr:hypothetical protein [Roseibacterium sp. SDUM158016]MCU4652404.1 hypothetical protein [Roseibacterium sp. SDUM158016]
MSRQIGRDRGPAPGDDVRLNAGRRVAELRPEEPARFNPDKLEELCSRIGEARAEREVALALDRIAATLQVLPRIADDGNPAVLRAGIVSLVRDADLIGMATLSRVARSVVICLDTGDRQAFAATIARLGRVGDRSIHAVWELEDLSG